MKRSIKLQRNKMQILFKRDIDRSERFNKKRIRGKMNKKIYFSVVTEYF